ncbi:MAG: hypothetical protein KDI79_13205 [Anaerolineae bacterium]|nr:hypothetical protein [Anaerolineae bacterium]
MNRKLVTIATVMAFLLVGITATAVFAGRNRTDLKLKDLASSIGSLEISGAFTGGGNTDLELTLTAHGEVFNLNCSNKGQQKPPPKNPLIKAEGTALFPLGSGAFDQNGKLTWKVIADEDDLSPKELGCPNNNWEPNRDELHVNWTSASITAKDPNNSQNVVTIEGKSALQLSCETALDFLSVTCTP